MELVPYEPRHLATFVPGAFDLANLRALAATPGWAGKAVAATENGHTLGLCGIAVVGDAAHVWLILSDALRRRPVKLCRMALAALPSLLALPGVTHIAIETDHPDARRWAMWLGFEPIDTRRMIYGCSGSKNSTCRGECGDICG